MGLQVTGPSALIDAYPARRAAILLAADRNGLVLFNQTGAALSQAEVIAAGGDKNYLQDTGSDADNLQDDFDDNYGLNRADLEIKNTTVEGTYTLRFTVDNLVREVKLQIVNPQPKVFVKSLWVDRAASAGTSVVNKFEPIEGDLGAVFNPSLDLIKIFDNGGGAYDTDDGADLFVNGVNGVYTVETRTKDGTAAKDVLYGKILVADLPVGTYDYEVRKEYPDGRIVLFTDKVKVESIANDQTAVFENSTANPQFNTNWKIEELYNPETEGTYVLSFTINNIKKVYTINVVAAPSLTIDSLTIARKEVVLFNDMYRSLQADLKGAVRASVKLENLTEDDFVLIFVDTDTVTVLDGATITGDGIAQGTDFATDLNTAAKIEAKLIPLKDLLFLDLGTLGGTLSSGTTKIVYTLRFYRATVKVSTNPANELGFELIGTQTITLSEDA